MMKHRVQTTKNSQQRFLDWKSTKANFLCEKCVLKDRDYLRKLSILLFFLGKMWLVTLQNSPSLLDHSRFLI